MPVTCIVVGCGSRFNRDNGSFYSVPKVLNNKFLINKNELSEKRGKLWLAAIKRDDLSESKIKNQRVCSKHFISGKPSSLEDKNDPDWSPSQNLGHVSQTFTKRPGAVLRQQRLKKRSRTDVDLDTVESYEDSEEHELEETEAEATGISSQTDLTLVEMSMNEERLRFASKKIADLQKKQEESPFGLMSEQSNKEKLIYFTGFAYPFIKQVIFPEVEEFISYTNTSALGKFNQLLLTLIKLRLDLHFTLLAYSFKISRTTASTYFEHIIDRLYNVLKPLIRWPERAVALKNIPSCFKEVFHDKTTVIVDCFEVFIEKPSSLNTQQRCWSNYKHHNTVKFLIGITPHGIISYISNAWGGRTSDKQMVELSDFLQNILPGDVVLADRGFLINETLGTLQAKLIIPAFTRGKKQLHPLELEASRHMAQVRIHVERIIGLIKNKFNILKGTIPISTIKKGYEGTDRKENMLDKIVLICSALVNLSPPIIPL